MDQLFRKYGQAPYNVVLVHGGPGAIGEMAEVAKELSPSFGSIESLHRSISIADQINELYEVIIHQTTYPVFLIGFSWGAWLSMLFCSEHEQLVKKLILIGCGPLEAKYAADVFNIRLSRLPLADQNKFITLLNSLANQDINDQLSVFHDLKNFIHKTDTFESSQKKEHDIEIIPEVFTSVWKEAEKLRMEGSLLAALKNIDLPIHVIHGDYDPHPATGIIKPLQQCNNDFQYVILQQCGHKPWIENRAQSRFYELMRKIISE